MKLFKTAFIIPIFALLFFTIIWQLQGKGASDPIYLPLILTPKTAFSLLGNVTQPVYVEPTAEGVLAAAFAGEIVNLDRNEVVLDMGPKFIENDGLAGAIAALEATDDELYVLTQARTAVHRRIELFAYSLGEDGRYDLDSERHIMAWAVDLEAIHYWGDLSFGPDGYLYITTGDGSQNGDPGKFSQNLALLYGSQFRIDPNKGPGAASDCSTIQGDYTIPVDNPFIDGPGGNCDEIINLGLRQVWRFSFDSQTGDMWLADVGGQLFEEINFAPADNLLGHNFGWSCYEGSAELNIDGCNDTYKFPLYAYAHTPNRCSIIGGFVYHGEANPTLEKKYIYTDFCDSSVLAFNPETGMVEEIEQLEGARWSTVSEDQQGEILLADYISGNIYRLVLLEE